MASECIPGCDSGDCGCAVDHRRAPLRDDIWPFCAACGERWPCRAAIRQAELALSRAVEDMWEPIAASAVETGRELLRIVAETAEEIVTAVDEQTRAQQEERR